MIGSEGSLNCYILARTQQLNRRVRGRIDRCDFQPATQVTWLVINSDFKAINGACHGTSYIKHNIYYVKRNTL